MGIKFFCPNGHKIHVKSFLAGKSGFCPTCQIKVQIPLESQMPAGAAAGGSMILSTADRNETSSNGRGGHAPPVATQPASSSAAARAHEPAPVSRINAAAQQPVAAAAPGQPATAGSSAPATPAPIGPPGAADPISESPTAVWYVRPPTGGQFGPAPGDVMRKWLVEGRVTASSYVWREGWPDWKQAAVVFPALAAAPAANPAVAGPSVNGSTAAATGRGKRSRRSNKTGPYIAAVVVLALACVGTFIALVMVLKK